MRDGRVVAALVAALLLAMVAAIVVPKLARPKGRAAVDAMRTDLRTIASAEERYLARAGHYQSHLDSLPEVGLTRGVRLLRFTASERGWRAVVGHDSVDTICTASAGDLKPETGRPGDAFCARPEARRDSAG